MIGVRVTDAVQYLTERRDDSRRAVRVVRQRAPDKLRWRRAVASLNKSAGGMRGKPRMRIEEPIRELVLDLGDADLRTEVVLDARRYNVDLDRGEVLPPHTMGDVRRFAFLVGADVRTIERYVKLPEDFMAPVDVPGCVVVSRAMAFYHRRRAEKLWLELPDQDGPVEWRAHHHMMNERAQSESERSKRWGALAARLMGPAF